MCVCVGYYAYIEFNAWVLAFPECVEPFRNVCVIVFYEDVHVRTKPARRRKTTLNVVVLLVISATYKDKSIHAFKHALQ